MLRCLRGTGGTSRAAPRADLPPPRAHLAPARHFQTSAANQGRAPRQAPPRAGRARAAAVPSCDTGAPGSIPGGGSGHVCAGGRHHAWPGMYPSGLGTPPRPSLSTSPAGGAVDRSQLPAAVPSTGPASGHPKGLQHLQLGGEIPLDSLGTTVNVCHRRHPSSELDRGQRTTPGL